MAATYERAKEIIEDESLAVENLLNELEVDDVPSHIREARIEALRKQARDYQHLNAQQHGKYTEITEEKAFLDLTTSEKKCVVHFFHEDFRRCTIMDQHLQDLALRHFETKFAKINVEKAKFFVAKLKIQVLPAVICFLKGVVVDRVVGFDDLGNTDDFPLINLERRLAVSGVIPGKEERRDTSIFGHQQRKREDSDSDEDW